MLILYVVIAVIGVALTTRLFMWRSRHAITAGIGTFLAVFAIISGFTIGWIVAPIALLVLAFAVARHLRPLDHSA